ncbi:MAG TPA: hypothetical protein VJR87_11280 [Allosphingosinicella sp.]|nr:hypothetical protein [Allosphingosinicella sp.]
MKALFSRLRHLLPASPQAGNEGASPFRLKRILSETRTSASPRYLEGSLMLTLDEAEGIKPLYDLSVYRSSDEDLALLLNESSGQ